jgi:DNA-directed RNA polymerase beta subunit
MTSRIQTDHRTLFPTPVIPDLVAIQYGSFQRFLTTGFHEAFESINPLICTYGRKSFQVEFLSEQIRFCKPEGTPNRALYVGKTYGCSVYIPVRLTCSEWETPRTEWILLGFLPLMTPAGHFIINGIPRVVLHQMVRNPGIYILPKDSRTGVPTVRIIPEQGSWINITMDKKHRIWVTTRLLRKKISIVVFLQALGIPFSMLKTHIKSQSRKASFRKHEALLNYSQLSPPKPKPFQKRRGQRIVDRRQRIFERARLWSLEQRLDRWDRLVWFQVFREPKTQLEACRYVYAHVQEYTGRIDAITDEAAVEFFNTIIWGPKNRYLGILGREQFHQKVGSRTPLTETHLTSEDMLQATTAFVQLVWGAKQGDDIDSLNNKQIRGCGNFLQDALVEGLREFNVFFTRKLLLSLNPETDTMWKAQKSSLSKLVSKSWKNFFTSGTLSQFLDETNPLAETTHKRRITVLGPGGVSSKQTTIQIRGIHPTYYGRLCPIETPEGQNAGLVNSLTVYSRFNNLGYIETPFYNVYKGQVQKYTSPKYYIPRQEINFRLAPADISISKTATFAKLKLPLRTNWNFDYGEWNQVSNQSIGVLQMISIATSLIPFLEHDDANRALMGSNMQRQAVPLIEPEPAYVQTGLESRVISDVQHSLHTPTSGYITSANAQEITVFVPNQGLYTDRRVQSAFSTLTTGTPIGSACNSQGEIPGIPSGIEGGDQRVGQWRRQLPSAIGNSEGVAIRSSLQPPQNTQNPDTYSKRRVELKQKKSMMPFLVPHKTKRIRNYEVVWPLVSTQGTKFTVSSHGIPSQKVQPVRSMGYLATDEESYSSHVVTNKKGHTCTISLEAYQRTNQSTCKVHRPIISEGEWVHKSDILADGGASVGGKVALGKNVLVAYVPWEGYNFEDAILISNRLVREDIFTSLHIDYYEVEIKNTQHGLEHITNQLPIEVTDSDRDIARIQRLRPNGLVPIGTWVQDGDYLVGKVTPLNPIGPSVQHQYEKLYNVIMQRETPTVRNTSLRVPKGVEGFVFGVSLLPPTEPELVDKVPKDAIIRVRVSLLQRRKIQVGDKIAGRHGNKGIVSKILSEHDMPYLPDGRPIDIVLNPLGVPSRMNVGQILECLLGFAGYHLHETYSMQLFDEQSGAEASRSFVYAKLLETALRTGKSWIFEPHHPGKMKLFDGRTGHIFDQPITVGYPYILKLVHLVDDKIHARSTGPYSAITQQPVRGRSRNGGQRLGEMEVWALQAYGAASILQELLTIKSDSIEGRKEAVFRIYTNQPIHLSAPESFRVLVRELEALCFEFDMTMNTKTGRTLFPADLEKLGKFLKK